MNSDSPYLFAGTGRRSINPPVGIAHGGWGAQKHEQAEGIDMDLWVTALALRDGDTTAVLLDVDIQILTNERADQIRLAVSRMTGLPIENIRAAATHTHSGPVPYKSWIEKGYELVAPWFDDVARWSAEAASEALDNLQPIQVQTGRGQCQINSNRRAITKAGERFLGINPDGPCDREVLVVRLATPEGKTVATLANFACHPTIMGPANRLITPDYPGAAKRVVEQAVGGRCLFFQGAAGDQGPIQGFQADPQVYRALGAILGHEIAKVCLGLSAIPDQVQFDQVIPSGAPLGVYHAQFSYVASLPLKILAGEIPVPLRDGLPERKAASEQLDHWKAALQTARARADEGAITKAIYMARRADIALRLADDFGGRTTAGVRAHFITLGEVAIIGCNIEPFCEIGMAVKRQSPFPITVIGGYTNGRMAYMPTAGEWSKGGYEVDNSPFGEDAAEVLTGEILRKLESIRGS